MNSYEFRRIADEKLDGSWSEAAVAHFLYTVVEGFISSLAGVGLLILGGPLRLGYAMFVDEIYRGERPNINTLFKGFTSNLEKSILLGLISQIYLFLWSMLFIIPGIIKAYSYAMIYYIQLDNPEMHYEDVITKSRQMMNGHKWRLFCLHFSYIGWWILSFLTFGILGFWVAPKVQIATYAFYKDLKQSF